MSYPRSLSYFIFSLTLFVAWSIPAKVRAAIDIAEVEHAGRIDFEQEIRPILRRSCLPCHNRSEAENDLVLETPETILAGGAEGPAVVPGKSADSLLLKLAAHHEDPIMPPPDNQRGAPDLTPQELGLIRLWIDQGAKAGLSATDAKINWRPLSPGVHPIYAATISQDGQVAAAGRANQLFVYHVPGKRELARLSDPGLLQLSGQNRAEIAHLDLVQSLAFSPDGEALASGAFREVKLWRRVRNVRKAEIAALESTARSLVVSRDGRWAAVGLDDGRIACFDLAAGVLARTLVGPANAVTGLAFSSDGLRLAAGTSDSSLRVWHAGDGSCLRAWEIPRPAGAIAWVNRDQWLAVPGSDGHVLLWDAAAGTEPVKVLLGHAAPVTSLAAVAGNDRQLVSGSQDGTVRTWDVTSGSQVRQADYGGSVNAVAVRSDGQRLAAVGAGNTVKLWNGANGEPVGELKGDYLAQLKSAVALRAVALARRTAEAQQRDLESANQQKQAEEENAKKADAELKSAADEFAMKEEAANKSLADKEAAEKKREQAMAAVAKAEDDQRAAEASLNASSDPDARHAAEALRTKAEQDLAALRAELEKVVAELKNLEEPVTQARNAKAAAEKKLLDARRYLDEVTQARRKTTEEVSLAESALRAAAERVERCETESAQAGQEARAAEKPWFAVAFSPDGSMLAAIDAGHQVCTFESESGTPLDVLAGAAGAAPLVAFDASNGPVTVVDRKLVIGSAHAGWRLERTIGSADSPDLLVDRVTALAFSRDGRYLASGGGEPSRGGELKIWDVATGSLLREVGDAHSDTILAVEFSHDDRYLASCAADRFMKVFDVQSGARVRSFEGHTHHVTGVSWSADDRTLVTAGADKLLKVWDFKTGDQRRTIEGFGKEVTAVRFVADTPHVVASCGDNGVHRRQTADGAAVRTYTGAADFVYSVDVSGDGQSIVAGCQDGVLRVWSEAGPLIAAFAPPE